MIGLLGHGNDRRIVKSNKCWVLNLRARLVTSEIARKESFGSCMPLVEKLLRFALTAGTVVHFGGGAPSGAVAPACVRLVYAAIVVSRHNPVIKAFYEKRTRAIKPRKSRSLP